MRKYIAELIGTFALVFCGTGAVIVDQQTGGAITHTGVALAFGLIVMFMIFAFGNLSGAHINPAVSIAFTLAKRFPVKMLGGYIISQVSGAILASITLRLLFPENILLGATMPAGTEIQSFIMELILTFILMFTVLNVADKGKEKGIPTALIIGTIVALEAFFAGPICGASMNPARSIGPAVASTHLEHLWLYIAAPIMGAALAVPVCDYLTKTKTT